MIHYRFDDPLDVALLLRGFAHEIEVRTTNFSYGPQGPAEKGFDAAVGALRVAAATIEKAVYDAPKPEG